MMRHARQIIIRDHAVIHLDTVIGIAGRHDLRLGIKTIMEVGIDNITPLSRFTTDPVIRRRRLEIIITGFAVGLGYLIFCVLAAVPRTT